MNPTTTTPNRYIQPLASFAMAFGCAGLCLMLGVLLGAFTPTGQSAPSGWYDVASIGKFLAILFFGCGGAIGGLIGGWFLGRKLAMTSPQIAVPVSAAVLALPILIWIIQLHNMSRLEGQVAVVNRQRTNQESAKQMAQEQRWLNSSQYADSVTKDLANLELFKKELGPITYPGSTLDSSPSPRTLVFETSDSVDKVHEFFKTAPVEMGYFGQAPESGIVYWKMGSMKGSINVRATAGKTMLFYSIESS